jgi:hypothetical protein
MRRVIQVALLVAVISPMVFVAVRITVLNPAWWIRWHYPDAELRLQTINSPDPHFWSAVSHIFGVPMTDPDHELIVTLRDRTENIDFLPLVVGADELFLERCRITDISGLLRGMHRLSGVTFSGCDLSQLPMDQRVHVRPQINQGPNIFYVPYESLHNAPLANFR